MSNESVRLHARVYGRVQGVNFRYYTIREATSRGLSGWVANRSDGTVEVVAEGERRGLEALLQFLHRGPRSARVDHVDAEWRDASGEFTGFRVRYGR
jgi:acylphosphatase